MPAAKEPVEVFEIDSSDDEGRAAVSRSREVPLRGSALPSTSGSQAVLTDSDYAKQKLGCRSFWQAGNFEIGPSKSASLKGELEHARVHPKFLHSNATSHKWAFGAIAELLDNSVDEICHGATSVKVDKILNAKDNSPALLFQDDGGGMDPDGIRKCMSLGYSSKKTNTTIGQYGNGFKTSTMRLGADVIVFSRSTRSGQATQSVGLLSYTFLRLTGQDDVIVPMVDFDISNNWAEPIIYGSQEDWSTNLNTILEWSPFPSKEDLMKQFESIGSHGTRIIIYNLWLNDEGIYELNFDDDDEDIELRDEATRGSASKLSKKAVELRSHISYRMRYSLRAYASILYMRKLKNFKIVLRGKPVEQFDIEDELIYPQLVTYKPQIAAISEEVSMKTTLGFIKQAPELNVSGFNVYHKNRLIRPFWKVTRDGSSVGNGVVGVLEANFIEPAHDKQDFERSALFIRLEARLKQMVLDYWRTHCHLIGYQSRMSNVQPPAKIQKQSHIVQAVMERPTASVQKHLQPAQPSIGGAAASRMTVTSVQLHSGGEKYQKDSSTVQPVVDPTADSRQEIPPVDGSTAISVDQICEENIQLFMRCEGSVRKQNELKQTINKLEKELEETRNKCAQLAAYIEGRKTQNLLLHQTGQV